MARTPEEEERAQQALRAARERGLQGSAGLAAAHGDRRSAKFLQQLSGQGDSVQQLLEGAEPPAEEESTEEASE